MQFYHATLLLYFFILLNISSNLYDDIFSQHPSARLCPATFLHVLGFVLAADRPRWPALAKSDSSQHSLVLIPWHQVGLFRSGPEWSPIPFYSKEERNSISRWYVEKLSGVLCLQISDIKLWHFLWKLWLKSEHFPSYLHNVLWTMAARLKLPFPIQNCINNFPRKW